MGLPRKRWPELSADALSLRADLERALPALGLALEAEQVSALMDYLALIQKWTKVYNLTAVRDPSDMLTLHILDSLAAIAPLQRQLGQAVLHSSNIAKVSS